ERAVLQTPVERGEKARDSPVTRGVEHAQVQELRARRYALIRACGGDASPRRERRDVCAVPVRVVGAPLAREVNARGDAAEAEPVVKGFVPRVNARVEHRYADARAVERRGDGDAQERGDGL